MCGSELPDEAVFCTNCGAACDDETESTAVLDEELVETARSSTDVEETTVLSQDDNEGTTVLEENIEETTVLEMNRDRDEDKETTVLSPSEKEKEAITTVIPNENGFDEAVNGIISDVKNHKKGIIVAIIAFILIVVVAISIAIWNSNRSDETGTEQSIIHTENSKQEVSDMPKDERSVTIVSVTGYGMNSNDATVSYNGYETEVIDAGETYFIEASGLCLYGTLDYSNESFFSDYEGHGGKIYDSNGNEIEWSDITNHKNISENDYMSEYNLTFYSDPNDKVFCVGLPDDITPGTYTIELYQFFGSKETSLEIRINVN